MPFEQGSNKRPFKFVVEEHPLRKDPSQRFRYKAFWLKQGFSYLRPAREARWVLPDKDTIEVDPDRLRATDLTSVPWFLRWFVSPYGTHAAAALVHDQYVDDDQDDVTRTQADDLFFEALGDCERPTPFLRRSILWGAVNIGTRWKMGGLRRIFMVLWILAALLGTAGLILGLILGETMLVVGSLVAPIPAAILWGFQPRRWWGAIVVAYFMPVLIPTSVIAFIAYSIYFAAEVAMMIVIWAAHATPGIRNWGWLMRLRAADAACRPDHHDVEGRPRLGDLARPTSFGDL